MNDIEPIEIRRYRERAEQLVMRVSEQVDASDGERLIIEEFERLVRHGYKFIDIKVRKDGREYRFQGDWLARLFR